MAPNTSIVWRCDLRESVLFIMMVASSANCKILTLLFCKRIPLQFGLWWIFNASNSTKRIKREGLSGHPCRMPLVTSK